MSQEAINLAKDLIEKQSVSPDDAGCMPLIEQKLTAAGFDCQWLNFEDVTNIWATHGSHGPTLALMGHTDVVPTGDEANWLHPPFSPTIVDDALYGRGACDMKGALASMVVAACRFVADNPTHPGRLAFLITSDEEAKAEHGTKAVVKWLQDNNEMVDYALIGEPSSSTRLGDVIKIGRRGSLSGKLTLKGTQGHVAYPEMAHNPIHDALSKLTGLLSHSWDEQHPDFPKTSLQFSNIEAGTGATNVIPGELTAMFNFRYSPATDDKALINAFESKLKDTGVDFEIDWHHSGLPFITSHQSPLVESVVKALKQHVNITPELSTNGGTSDGRFIAQMGTDVVELGPLNKTIHQVNEWVSVQNLVELTAIYHDVIESCLNSNISS